MSVLLRKVIWYRKSNPTVPINITDAMDMTANRGLDIKNNIATLRLKNSSTQFDSAYGIEKLYVDDNGNIMFEESDQVRIYLHYTDDMADVEDSAWSNSSQYDTVLPSNDYLKGTYFVIEFSVNHDEKGSFIKIKCADKCYILFNRLWAQAFTVADSAMNTPEILQTIVRHSSESPTGAYVGEGSNAGVSYDVDAKLFSTNVLSSGTTDGTTTNKLVDSGATFITDGVTKGDWVKNTTDDVYAYVSTVDDENTLSLNKDIFISGEAYQVSNGFIQNVRTSTCADGTANTVTTFPDIAISKIWKPVYEWIADASGTTNINTSDELSGVSSLVYGRPFLFYVDEQNRFHWFETTNNIDETITIGTTTGILSYKLDKKVFDTINFIIFRGGEDFYGNGLLGYDYDPNTNVKSLKMRVVPMTKVAELLIKAEKDAGNLVANAAGSFTYGGNRYNRNGVVTPKWLKEDETGTTYNDDDDYNNALRVVIKERCVSQAKSLLKGLGHARYKGSIERKGTLQIVGSLIHVTNSDTGQNAELLRVTDVRDKVDKTGWYTTINVEQDKEAMIAGQAT